MENIFDGKALAEKIKHNVKEKVATLSEKPCLACIIVGQDKASETYVKSKKKACEQCGIESLVLNLPESTSKTELVELIQGLNNNKNISGILVQLPLPQELDTHREEIINTISPEKDVDCLTDLNLGRLVSGTSRIAPCTATGIMRILKEANVSLDGKKVCVVGRSLLVGKSVSLLLQQANATVTMCHSHTKNLAQETSQADVLVIAVGKPKMITSEFVKPGGVVVDVGINRTEQGLVGDVDFDNVKDKCSCITPVPGGVGPLTVACLMENTFELHNLAHSKAFGKE